MNQLEKWITPGIPGATISDFALKKAAPEPTPEPVETEDLVSERIVTKHEKPALLCGNGGLQQLLPLRFPAFRELYLKGRKNDWWPTEVPMEKDVQCWNRPSGSPGSLTDDERRMVLMNLSFFSTAEQRIQDHASQALLKYIDCPEAKMALGRLVWEEVVHQETFMFIITSLGLREDDVYGLYRSCPSIQLKDAFLADETSYVANNDLDLNKVSDQKAFLKAIYAQMLMEGVLFYSGFAMNLRLVDQNKMTGIGKQYEFIMRDETQHLALVRLLFNTLKDGQFKAAWDDDMRDFCVTQIRKAVELESAYSRDVVPRGIMGLNADSFREYVQYIADRRLQFIDMEPIYNVPNPFPWLNKLVDFEVDANYFEGPRTTYQLGGLRWD